MTGYEVYQWVLYGSAAVLSVIVLRDIYHNIRAIMLEKGENKGENTPK